MEDKKNSPYLPFSSFLQRSTTSSPSIQHGHNDNGNTQENRGNVESSTNSDNPLFEGRDSLHELATFPVAVSTTAPRYGSAATNAMYDEHTRHPLHQVL